MSKEPKKPLKIRLLRLGIGTLGVLLMLLGCYLICVTDGRFGDTTVLISIGCFAFLSLPVWG